VFVQPCRFDLASRGFQAVDTTRKQPDVGASSGERANRRAPDPAEAPVMT
jgi:hypothetical protein